MHLRLARCAAFSAALGVSCAPAVAADQALIDAARKDGQALWYTSLIIDQFVRPAAAAFEKKYGIKVEFVRGDASELAARLYNEAQGGHTQADIFDGTVVTVSLKKQNLVAKWSPESAARLPKEYVDPDGYWVSTNIYVNTPGYNTNLVPKGSEPTTYEALLDPKWRGKIAWGSTSQVSAAPGFVAMALRTMGEPKGMEYLQALSKQNVASLSVSARQVLDQVIAGEYAIALQIFNNHAVISASQGAPVAWIPMNPVMYTPSTFAIMKDAPHPNAARLLLDFLVSSDGQQIFRDADYLPVDPAIPPRDPSLRPDGVKLKGLFFSPEDIDAGLPKWTDIYKKLFS
jgi:iron(III) transport system substrate-binding protein